MAQANTIYGSEAGKQTRNARRLGMSWRGEAVHLRGSNGGYAGSNPAPWQEAGVAPSRSLPNHSRDVVLIGEPFL